MLLDPFQLLLEARRTQESRFIDSALDRFYNRLVLRGLLETSARQYCTMMASYFKANRVPLQRRKPSDNE